MKRFIFRVVIFLLPVLLLFVLVLLVDPFNYTGKTERKDDDVKRKISYNINNALQKLIAYEKHPTEKVFLGDSRTNAMKLDSLKLENRESYSNMAYGGASLLEIMNTFWQIVKYADIQEVYLGINFNLYNLYNDRNRVDEAVELKKNVFVYVFNRYSVKATYQYLKYKVSGRLSYLNVPKGMNKDDFWKYSLNVSIANYYQDYLYPDSYFQELEHIATYCRDHNIKLILFIPPTHIDLQNRIDDFSLRDAEKRFKSDLTKLGVVYDFDYPSEITVDKSNFKDPFHCKPHVSQIVLDEVLSGHLKFGKLLQ